MPIASTTVIRETQHCSFSNPTGIGLTGGAFQLMDCVATSTQVASIQTYTSSTQSSSTIPSVYNGFTYGEIINSVWLFFIFSVVVFFFFTMAKNNKL